MSRSAQPRLLVLSVYPEDQAGTRLRATQYAPALRAAGIEVSFWSFLSLDDSRRWFGTAGPLLRALILLRSVLRLAQLPGRLRRADVVLILREVLPIASHALERMAARRAAVVWDVDDAIWTDYPRLFASWVPKRLRRSPAKYAAIAALATEVWAGSELLAEWCREHSDHVTVVPTVVPIPDREDAVHRSGLVWVGSASTAEHLQAVLPAVGTAVPTPDVTCVGARGLDPCGVRLHEVPWSEAAEDEALRRARVGLYPLRLDHPLALGKAGLKAVLYMAYGLPCVVTPTPTNVELVRDGQEGLHARTPDEWTAAVQRLLEDDALWQRLASAASERARTHYSLEAWAPMVTERLLQIITTHRRRRRRPRTG